MKNKKREKHRQLTLIECEVQAVLRGFFDDPTGFNDMSEKSISRAVRSLQAFRDTADHASTREYKIDVMIS